MTSEAAPVGLLFCRALIKAKSLKVLRDADVTMEMVYDDARKALEAIVRHQKKFGKVPSAEWVKRRTGVELPSPKGLDLPETYAEEIRSRYIAKVLTDELREINKAVREDPEEGANRLQKAWAKIQAAKLTRRAHLVNVTDPRRVDERKEKYDKLESHKGFDGVLFPWQSLNESCMGMQPGTVHIFSAMEKTGKTFLLVECAAHCWANQEKPPLFVTMEMPPDQIERRFDASAGKFAYERLRKARLGVFAKKNYFDFLDGLKEKRPFWIADSRSVRTVEEIANLAVELDVSAVYLDGVYILARHGADAMWERTLEVVASCKDQAKITQLPWVLTTQLATSLKADATTATTRDLGYAKMIAQWADAIYAFFGNKDLKKNNRRIMRTLAAREFQNIDLLLNFDLETMNFSEIGIVEGNSVVKVTSEEALEAKEEEKPGEEVEDEEKSEEKKAIPASSVLIPF